LGAAPLATDYDSLILFPSPYSEFYITADVGLNPQSSQLIQSTETEPQLKSAGLPMC